MGYEICSSFQMTMLIALVRTEKKEKVRLSKSLVIEQMKGKWEIFLFEHYLKDNLF